MTLDTRTQPPPGGTRPLPARTLAGPGRRGLLAAGLIGSLLAAGVWSLVDLQINLATLADSVGNARDFLSRTVPLEFPPVGELVALCAQTLAIVLCATLLAVLISVPLAVLAAGNTSPAATTRHGARALVVVARAVPDVVLAIVFFRLFGLGALAGVLAMGLHSVGMVAKLYADAIEQIDEGPRAAVRATGAGRLQELAGGVAPQVFPAFVATALHRFDINLRVSVVLGFVGVGGLGFEIASALRRLDYQRGMALALIVLALCIAVELASGAIRRRLLGATAPAERRGGHGCRLRLRRAAHPLPGSVARPVPGRARQPRLSPPWDAARIRGGLWWLVVSVAVAASVYGIDVDAGRLLASVGQVGETVDLFWPPETGGIMPTLLAELAVTVQIALAATVLGAVLALPIGAMAARNVAPGLRVARTFRVLIVGVRGVPELILAIVFVVITGLGPVAGALALALGCVGLLGKLVADSLEETDPGVAQAVRATGAGRLQVFVTATLPQAAPALVAHLMYQLDVNIRAATLLGIVGAGGIGFYLLNAARVLEFGVVTTIMLLVFATVLLVEVLAMWLRQVVR